MSDPTNERCYVCLHRHRWDGDAFGPCEHESDSSSSQVHVLTDEHGCTYVPSPVGECHCPVAVIDGVCHEDDHPVIERTVRCPTTRLWALGSLELGEREPLWASDMRAECPVCAPITYRSCAGCYGTGWIVPGALSAISRTLRVGHLEAPLPPDRLTGDAAD